LGSEPDQRLTDLQRRLEQALAECVRLRDENARLRARLNLPPDWPPVAAHSLQANQGTTSASNQQARPPATRSQGTSRRATDSPASRPDTLVSDEQVSLLKDLFRGREDVYAVWWEARDGRTGYSPVCRREWEPSVCRKPAVRCAECKFRDLASLTDGAIRDHLAGRRTVGIYPLLPDETCWFLAIDLDKACWRDDVTALVQVSREAGVPVSIERSRSGNGAQRRCSRSL
jgi:hypothetical protein